MPLTTDTLLATLLAIIAALVLILASGGDVVLAGTSTSSTSTSGAASDASTDTSDASACSSPLDCPARYRVDSALVEGCFSCEAPNCGGFAGSGCEHVTDQESVCWYPVGQSGGYCVSASDLKELERTVVETAVHGTLAATFDAHVDASRAAFPNGGEEQVAAPPPVPSPTDVDANVAGSGADGAQAVNDDSCVMCTKQMPQCEITCEDGMACTIVEQTCTTCAFAECRVDTKASTIAQKLPLIELVSGNGTATAMDQNCVMCTKMMPIPPSDCTEDERVAVTIQSCHECPRAYCKKKE